MALLKGHRMQFETLQAAFRNGDVALMNAFTGAPTGIERVRDIEQRITDAVVIVLGELGSQLLADKRETVKFVASAVLASIGIA